MNRIIRVAFYAFLIVLTGCSSLQSFDADWINGILYTPTPVPTKITTATPQPTQVSEVSTGEPEPSDPEERILRIWLPPQFDPNINSSAAISLKQRLAAFETQHPGLEIDVRIKAEEGEADLLNSLSITNMAAPGALPDLVALSRPALEVAAQKGFILPIDDLPGEQQNAGWYPYARELARVNGTSYGIPFAGDALVIMYRTDLVWIKTWDDILLSESQLMFAGADPGGEVGLALYESAGGDLVNAQGKPTLDQEILTQVLELFSKGRSASLFPDAVTNISSDLQVLQEYRARRAEMAITHFSGYHGSQDGLVQPLIGLNETHFTLTTGWIWALTGQDPETQQMSLELAEFLTAENFLSNWTDQTGYLPARQSDLSADSPIPAIITAMQPAPSEDTVLVLGPIMQDAVLRVLSGEQPKDVARTVVEKLK